MMTRCVSIPGGRKTPRDRLRDCWLRFDWLAEQARDKDYERGQEAQEELLADHQSALDELVAAGELDASVAPLVRTAFDAAVHHVWRANAPITCYEAVMIDYKPVSSAQLTQQAALLAEMADDRSLDPDVVAQAQVAIERDVAFLNLTGAEVEVLYQEIQKLVRDGGPPSFDEIDLEITPQAVQAAEFLVELLLKE
jgi:hypothetical protein